MCLKVHEKRGDRLKRVIIELDEEFHKRLKIFCFTEGITLKEYITGCVKKDLEQKQSETIDK